MEEACWAACLRAAGGKGGTGLLTILFYLCCGLTSLWLGDAVYILDVCMFIYLLFYLILRDRKGW